MRVLILEDEKLSAERLCSLCLDLEPDTDILATLPSVAQAERWLTQNSLPDLMLVDIHLADGSSFELFRRVPVQAPLIFTTAYDRYAIEAFKHNSIDYLLKPIDRDELQRAFAKYSDWKDRRDTAKIVDIEALTEKIKQFNISYKQRFLVRFGDNLLYKNNTEIAYFYAEDKTVFLVSTDGKRFVIDYRLDQLDELLDPTSFFRVNRKFIIRIDAIQRMRSVLGSRLQLYLKPVPETDVYVSKERVAEFKAWLDQ
jgi:two-component system, LytTR family, response regulator LytT